MKKKILNILGWVVLSPFIVVITVFLLKFLCYPVLIGLQFFNMLFGADYEQKYLYQFEIEAMKDNHTYVTSRYSGDSELRYYFIRERDGAIYTGYTKANQSSIIEDGGNYVEVYTEVPEVATGFYNIMDKLASFDGSPMTSKEYIYHVPEGSIDYDYKVDLE
jgi:PDZ domain-containing secreted protein